MQVATTLRATSLFADEPTAHWVEGREINALADIGSQVNTVMPSNVCQYEFPVLPLHDLVNHPLNLIGLGGMRTCPPRLCDTAGTSQ